MVNRVIHFWRLKKGRTAPLRGRMGARSGREYGYSLLEVLVALALAGLTTGTIALAWQQSIHLQSLLDGRVTATVLGMSKLAELEAGSEKLSSGEFPPPYERYRWIAQEEGTASGSTVVNLTIKWSGGNHHPQQKMFRGFPSGE
jgi:prepilin-type N-terminal cleavage/methylation domain-containing protein